jgi:hypothetical protein
MYSASAAGVYFNNSVFAPATVRPGMVDVSVWDIAKIKDDLFDLNDNKSLLPVLEGTTLLITSVIN